MSPARIAIAFGGLFGAACLVLGQTPASPSFTFEAASIKPNVSGSGSSSSNTGQGRLTATNVTVKQLIMQAYRVQDFQIIGGPDWIDTERFNVQAKAEDGAIPDTPPPPDDPDKPRPLELMIQSMLADRFQLSLNRETRELPVYTLTVAKDGPKIKPVSPEQNEIAPPTQAGAGRGGDIRQTGAVGAGSMNTNVNRTKGEMNANTVPISRFVTALSRQLRRPVIDKTDLKGMYTLHLEWTPDSGPIGGPNTDAPSEPTGPSLFTAIQEQLGLRLSSTKGPVDVLVIRNVQKPSEN